MLPAHPPANVYLDTAFVVNAVISHGQNSFACLRASEELIARQSTVYFSEVLRLEYAQALRRLATRLRLPSQLVSRFDLNRWQDVDVRRQWLVHGSDQLEQYLSLLPEVIELPLHRTVLDQSVYHMARYSMGSLDATHLATALHYNIPVFWTCDDHFRRVDDLSVEIIRDAA